MWQVNAMETLLIILCKSLVTIKVGIFKVGLLWQEKKWYDIKCRGGVYQVVAHCDVWRLVWRLEHRQYEKQCGDHGEERWK
jgi:hypothetical protein